MFYLTLSASCAEPQIDKIDVTALYAKGKSLYYKNDTDKAFAVFSEIIEINPDYYHAYFMIGKIYYFTDRNADAVEYFTKALMLKPDDITFMKWLGKSYLKDENNDKAFTILNKAIYISPEDPSLLLLYAKCLKDKNNLQESIVYFNKAFLFELELAYSHFELSSIYGSFGLKEKMKKEMERGIFLGDDNYAE